MAFLWWCGLLQPVKIVFWDQRHRFSSFLIAWKHFGELLGPYLAILAPMLPELAYAYYCDNFSVSSSNLHSTELKNAFGNV